TSRSAPIASKIPIANSSRALGGQRRGSAIPLIRLPCVRISSRLTLAHSSQHDDQSVGEVIPELVIVAPGGSHGEDITLVPDRPDSQDFSSESPGSLTSSEAIDLSRAGARRRGRLHSRAEENRRHVREAGWDRKTAGTGAFL